MAKMRPGRTQTSEGMKNMPMAIVVTMAQMRTPGLERRRD